MITYTSAKSVVFTNVFGLVLAFSENKLADSICNFDGTSATTCIKTHYETLKSERDSILWEVTMGREAVERLQAANKPKEVLIICERLESLMVEYKKAGEILEDLEGLLIKSVRWDREQNSKDITPVFRVEVSPEDLGIVKTAITSDDLPEELQDALCKMGTNKDVEIFMMKRTATFH